MSAKGDFLSPILEFPARVRDAFTDPVRRRHVFAKCFETGLAGLAAGGVVGYFGPWALFVAPLVARLVDIAVYEFVTEPLGWAGHYWERGPRDGETFTNL